MKFYKSQIIKNDYNKYTCIIDKSLVVKQRKFYKLENHSIVLFCALSFAILFIQNCSITSHLSIP